MTVVTQPYRHQRWYVDIQIMPKSHGFIGIIEAREGLTGWLEARMIKNKDVRVWEKFCLKKLSAAME